MLGVLVFIVMVMVTVIVILANMYMRKKGIKIGHAAAEPQYVCTHPEFPQCLMNYNCTLYRYAVVRQIRRPVQSEVRTLIYWGGGTLNNYDYEID